MTKQDTLIWDLVHEDELALDYHKRQFHTPYRSTVHLFDFLERNGLLNQRGKLVVDFGAGMGAAVCYGARRFPNQDFLGIDINPGLVKAGKEMIKSLGIKNSKLEIGDMFKLDDSLKRGVGTVLSFQVLVSMPDLEETLRAMASTGAKTIAMSSLFTESQVEVRCVIRDHSRPLADKSYFPAEYNVYPIGLVKTVFDSLGYTDFVYEPFEIDIDLPRKSHGGLATFTETLSDGHRLQFSGPIFMPWYFVAASKPD
jgi:Methyltransferase domain